MKKTYNIIGAGITSATIARKLAEAGYKVNVYEKREHIGGNVFDYKKDGILIHKYGPHIFHTSKDNVINFIDKFWELNGFKNVVEGYVDNKLVPIPFNFKSIDICFPEESEIIKKELKKYNKESITILELRKSENPLIKKLAEFVYENLFLNYTTKMWNLKPDEIDESVTARIPIVLSYKNTYFNDKYEGLPKRGYTKTVEDIFNHPNIKVKLGVDANNFISFKDDVALFDNKEENIIYTGAIDSLFNFEYGALDYRSLEFKFETIEKDRIQQTAVVNYPAHESMTRITEYKNMTLEKNPNKTIISKEFPGTFNKDAKKWNEPYYPLATDKAREKYNKYYERAKKYKNLYLAGRMATYKYLNMDQAIDLALNLAEELIENDE